MLVEKYKMFEVYSFDHLWQMYKDEEIGNVGGQTLPENIKKPKGGTELEKIERLLGADPDNFYNIEFTGNYEITIIGFSLTKTFDKPVKNYHFSMGENGKWEEETEDDLTKETPTNGAIWQDCSYNGVLSLTGAEYNLKPLKFKKNSTIEPHQLPPNEINSLFPWNIVEENYPNYYSSDIILENEDLLKKLEENNGETKHLVNYIKSSINILSTVLEHVSKTEALDTFYQLKEKLEDWERFQKGDEVDVLLKELELKIRD